MNRTAGQRGQSPPTRAPSPAVGASHASGRAQVHPVDGLGKRRPTTLGRGTTTRPSTSRRWSGSIRPDWHGTLPATTFAWDIPAAEFRTSDPQASGRPWTRPTTTPLWDLPPDPTPERTESTPSHQVRASRSQAHQDSRDPTPTYTVHVHPNRKGGG